MRKIKTVVELLDYRANKAIPVVSEIYRGKTFDLPTMTNCSVEILNKTGKNRKLNASIILKHMAGANHCLKDRGNVVIDMTPEYGLNVRKYNYRVKAM